MWSSDPYSPFEIPAPQLGGPRHIVEPRVATTITLIGILLAASGSGYLAPAVDDDRLRGRHIEARSPPPRSDTGGVAAVATGAADMAPVAREVRIVGGRSGNAGQPCAQQTWPYFEARCLARGASKPPTNPPTVSADDLAKLTPLTASGPVGPAARADAAELGVPPPPATPGESVRRPGKTQHSLMLPPTVGARPRVAPAQSRSAAPPAAPPAAAPPPRTQSGGRSLARQPQSLLPDGIDDTTVGLRAPFAIRNDDEDEIEAAPASQRQLRRRAYGRERVPFGPIFDFPHRAFGGFLH